MAGYVEIANAAASKIGEDDQLRTPDDDTHLGRTVKANWTIVRQAALRDHSWNFAMKRAELAALADVPDGVLVGWAYAYEVPADALRIVELLDWPGNQDFQLEGPRLLFDDEGPLKIRYIRDVVEPADWDALFVEAFACRLAYQICDRITGDRGRKKDQWDAYREALSQAKRVDARENPAVPQEPSGWELARLGYGNDFWNVPFRRIIT